MTKYKAGDLVTIRIDEKDAINLNTINAFRGLIGDNQIIKHEPAPEPIVGYVNIYDNPPSHFGEIAPSLDEIEQFKKSTSCICLVSLKLTYCPATGKASAEVV